jgi:hypothetical protein
MQNAVANIRSKQASFGTPVSAPVVDSVEVSAIPAIIDPNCVDSRGIFIETRASSLSPRRTRNKASIHG